VAIRGNEIVLVREQGPDDAEPHWNLPGGIVERGETLIEALRREAAEEAGIELQRAGALLWVAEVQHEGLGGRSYFAFTFRIDEWSGLPGATGRDPMVSEAALIPLPEAREMVARREPRFSFVYEPLLDWLDGKFAAGAFYSFEVKGGRNQRLRGP